MKRILSGVLLAVLIGVLLQGCAGSRSAQRPTNTELRILFQSCMQGDLLPCG